VNNHLSKLLKILLFKIFPTAQSHYSTASYWTDPTSLGEIFHWVLMRRLIVYVMVIHGAVSHTIDIHSTRYLLTDSLRVKCPSTTLTIRFR